MFELHYEEVERITGRKHSALIGKGGIRLVAKALEREYGKGI
jgi:hypothetical protein